MAVKVDTQKVIIFGSSDPNISRVLSNKEKNGELRKVVLRIYTTNLAITSWLCANSPVTKIQWHTSA